MKLRLVAVLSLALVAAATARAQNAPPGGVAEAEALDRALGPAAALPRPDAPPPPAFTWLPPAFPPWLAAQPYRQQPLFATVPVGGTARGRVRGAP